MFLTLCAEVLDLVQTIYDRVPAQDNNLLKKKILDLDL